MDKTITIDQVALLGPLIAAQLLNAYYSVLLLKQQKGIDLTQEIDPETLMNIFSQWSKFLKAFDDLQRMPKNSTLSENQ